MVNGTVNDQSLRSVSRVSVAEDQKASTSTTGGAFYQGKDGTSPRKTQVLPVSPTLNSRTKRSLRETRGHKLTFLQAFGVYGVPMLLITVLSLAWTAWLIFVSLVPNEAANLLMGTTDYDNGQFWLIIDTDPILTRAGVACLIVVGLCYLFVTLKMILWREKAVTPAMILRLEERLINSWRISRIESRTWSMSVGPRYRRVYSTWKELTSFNGKKRKVWNAFTKNIDLVMQSIVLLQMLRRGSPVELVYGYASFVAANSLSCAANILFDWLSPLTEVLIDSIFDFAAAVLFPIATLIFCYYNFEFDREAYLTYLEILVPGSFEHIARLFADQSEIALFRVSFDSLRFSSTIDLCIRVAMNLAFCYRIKRVVEVSIWRRRHGWASGRTLRKSSGTIVPVEHKTAVPKIFGVILTVFSGAVLVLAQQSVTHSFHSCVEHPECVVYSHRWTASEHCPCIIFIDIDKAPKTYEQWLYPPDTYESLKAMSTFGLLESVQIINRQLLEVPEELRSCHNLREIQLMYTSIQCLPLWTVELKALETLHIEGKMGSQNLRELPANLFSDLPRLAMIHFGVHENLERLPGLTGVPHLQSLSLAWIFGLRELPSFEFVPDLRRLVISVVPNLETIPDMAPLRKLVDFSIMAGVICCNGFLGVCDLRDFFCMGNPLLGFPPATCLLNDNSPKLPAPAYQGSIATKAAFQNLPSNPCFKMPPGAVLIDNTPNKEKVDMCAGKQFRECPLPGNVTGICYSMRFQVLSCINDETRIALRRLQIEKGVGSKCDPVEEKWLGCRDELVEMQQNVTRSSGAQLRSQFLGDLRELLALHLRDRELQRRRLARSIAVGNRARAPEAATMQLLGAFNDGASERKRDFLTSAAGSAAEEDATRFTDQLAFHPQHTARIEKRLHLSRHHTEMGREAQHDTVGFLEHSGCSDLEFLLWRGVELRENFLSPSRGKARHLHPAGLSPGSEWPLPSWSRVPNVE